MSERCETCKHWFLWNGTGDCPVDGQCRRYPPLVYVIRHFFGPKMSMNCTHPITPFDHRCGEWEPELTENPNSVEVNSREENNG